MWFYHLVTWGKACRSLGRYVCLYGTRCYSYRYVIHTPCEAIYFFEGVSQRKTTWGMCEYRVLFTTAWCGPLVKETSQKSAMFQQMWIYRVFHRLVSQVTPPFSRTYVDATGCPFTCWTSNGLGLIFLKTKFENLFFCHGQAQVQAQPGFQADSGLQRA